MVDIFLKRRYKMRVFIFSASATSSGPSPSLLTFSLMIALRRQGIPCLLDVIIALPYIDKHFPENRNTLLILFDLSSIGSRRIGELLARKAWLDRHPLLY